LYVAFLLGNVALAIFELLALFMLPGPEAAEAPREAARSILVAAVWIPYFLTSRRVKVTFVR